MQGTVVKGMASRPKGVLSTVLSQRIANSAAVPNTNAQVPTIAVDVERVCGKEGK